MSNWAKNDFVQEANKIGAAFVAGESNGGASINDLLVKSAREHNLLPEQIRRLTRKTNETVFNLKHKAKTAGDRYVEFDVGDDAKVISALMPTKVASINPEAYPDLPDELETRRPGYVTEKVAEESIEKIASDIVDILGGPENAATKHLHWEKVAEVLTSEKEGAEIRWNEAMTSLAHATKRASWNHDKFEKNAVGLYGTHAIPELNALRERVGISSRLPTDCEAKVASFRDHHVPEESEATRLLGRAINARETYVRALDGQKVATDHSSNYRKMIPR